MRKAHRRDRVCKAQGASFQVLKEPEKTPPMSLVSSESPTWVIVGWSIVSKFDCPGPSEVGFAAGLVRWKKSWRQTYSPKMRKLERTQGGKNWPQDSSKCQDSFAFSQVCKAAASRLQNSGWLCVVLGHELVAFVSTAPTTSPTKSGEKSTRRNALGQMCRHGLIDCAFWKRL